MRIEWCIGIVACASDEAGSIGAAKRVSPETESDRDERGIEDPCDHKGMRGVMVPGVDNAGIWRTLG